MPRPDALAFAAAVAIVAALVIALQLTQHFRTGDEAGLVMGAIVLLLGGAAIVLAVVIRGGAGETAQMWTALGLAVLATLFSGWPRWMETVDARSTNPFPSSFRDVQIVIEFLLPALAGLLVLWQLTLRACRRAAGRDTRTVWPWYSIGLAALVFLNPLGLELMQGALLKAPADFLWNLTVTVVSAAAAIVIIIGVIEIALRARRLRRPIQAEV